MRLRVPLAGLLVAAVGISLLAFSGPAQATTSSYHPPIQAVSAPSPKAMLAAHGHLFIATDDRVVVLSQTGAPEKTFTDMAGARDLVLSPNGATLYVALSGSGQVAVIDVASLVVTSTWTAAPCVTWLALAGATLFYSDGCESLTAHIGALATADGAALDTGLTETFRSPPRIVAAGGTLVVAAYGYPVTRYDISGSTLARGTDETSTTEYLEDLATSPDGTSVATASGGVYELRTLNPVSLAETATFDTGAYPTAVSYSHSSELLAGGLWQPYGDELFVFNRTTGVKLVSGPVVAPGGWNIPVLAGTVTFSDDDTKVFALAQDLGTTDTYLVTSTTAAPLASAMSLTVVSPKKFGRPVTSTVRVGLPGVPVTFTAKSNGKTTKYVATTDSSGAATWRWTSRFSGTVKASFAGDVTHLASTRSAKFTEPSRMTLAMNPGYRKRSGIVYYKAARKVVAVATLRPTLKMRVVTARLLAHRSGHWASVGKLKLRTDAKGRVGVYLQSAKPKTIYKITFTFSGGSFNRGSSVSTPRFTIG